MKEQLVNYLYDQNIATVLEGFWGEEREQIARAYRADLEKTYQDIDSINVSLEKATVVFDRGEKNRWRNVSLDQKRKMLIVDEALDKLAQLSSQAFMYASEKKRALQNGENYTFPINDEYVESSIQTMKDLSNHVMPFNKKAAAILLSEGIVDLEYASGKNDHYSFRNYRS